MKYLNFFFFVTTMLHFFFFFKENNFKFIQFQREKSHRINYHVNKQKKKT